MGALDVPILGWQSVASAGWLAVDVETLRAIFVALWVDVGLYFNAVVGFLFTYGKEIVGLLGGAYGILNWWYYRETVLHRRLKKYLERQDQRLKDARADILYSIARPGERRQFKEPIFAVAPLKNVLRRRGFDTRWSWQSSEGTAEKLLEKATREIGKRFEVLERTQKAYREQAVTAHVLKGAVAGLRAQRGSRQEADWRTKALHEFRTALAIPGNDHRLFALEHQGHQLRCLGMLDEACKAYEQLAVEVQAQLDGKDRDLMLANALRWGAAAHQAKRWFDSNPGVGSQIARDLIGATQNLSGALLLRKRYEPYREWDAIEQGDLEYLAAFVAHNLGYANVRDERLVAAETAYKNALPNTKHPSLLRAENASQGRHGGAQTRRASNIEQGRFRSFVAFATRKASRAVKSTAAPNPAHRRRWTRRQRSPDSVASCHPRLPSGLPRARGDRDHQTSTAKGSPGRLHLRR